VNSGEFVFELELHPCCKESGSFQQPPDQRIDAVLQNAAQALRNSRIFLGELPRMLVEQLKFGVVEIEKFPVHARSQSIDDNFSGLDNIGDELDRNMQRMAHQLAGDHKAHLELDGIELFVARYAQGIGRDPRFIVDDRGSDFVGDLPDAVLVDGTICNIGKSEVQNRFPDVGRILHVDRRIQRYRVQERVEIACDFRGGACSR